MLNWLLQVVNVTRFSLQSLPERKGSAATAVFGIAGVVAVLVVLESFAERSFCYINVSSCIPGLLVNIAVMK